MYEYASCCMYGQNKRERGKKCLVGVTLSNNNSYFRKGETRKGSILHPPSRCFAKQGYFYETITLLLAIQCRYMAQNKMVECTWQYNTIHMYYIAKGVYSSFSRISHMQVSKSGFLINFTYFSNIA